MPTHRSAKLVELEISGLSLGGRGVARRGGLVWFVAGGLPGDRLTAETVARRRSYGEAQAVRVARPGPHRRRPPCPFQERCGGCPWMALDDAQQRLWKQRLLAEALERIGTLPELRVEPVRRVSETVGYRNKVEFGVGAAAIGLVDRDPRRGLVDLSGCLLQHPQANAILATVRGFLLEGRVLRGASREHRLVLRRSWSDGKILVLLREGARPFPRARALAAHLIERHADVSGVVRLRGRSGRRAGARAETLAGRSWVREMIAGVELRLPPATFFQVNAAGASALIGLVAESAGPVAGRTVVDLYGGVGAYSFELLGRGAAGAVVCDADPTAIECGREAARRARVAGIEHRHERVASFLAAGGLRRRTPDVVVANPPREGLGSTVCRGLLRVASRRLVVVSCDPATLARDLRWLSEGGYRIERVVPVDLFPQTAHVESVVTLTRT